MTLDYLLGLTLGLIFGSFFNVIIHRLPLHIEGVINKNKSQNSLLQNLSWPASSCTNCHKKLNWFDNIPVISWLLLKGQCRFCNTSIKPRYLIVEIITAIAFMHCFSHYGFEAEVWLWLAFFSIAIILFFIDAETFYLPDLLTIPFLLLGILASFLGVTNIEIYNSFIGAALGFMILYSINFIYKAVRKVDGLGAGDFKLLAALGAWFGWGSLLPIIGLSSGLALFFILLMHLFTQSSFKLNSMIPLGPFLILSGFILYVQTYLF